MLTITAYTAAALTLLMVVLALDTIRRRMTARVSLGTGDDAGLTSASRAHGNLTENAPMALILIALLEGDGADPQLLAGVAGIFVVARVLHAIGIYMSASSGVPLPRSIGVVSTLLILLGLAGWLLARIA